MFRRAYHPSGSMNSPSFEHIRIHSVFALSRIEGRTILSAIEGEPSRAQSRDRKPVTVNQGGIMYLFLAQGAQRPSTLVSLMPVILIFIIFYFLIIKPQKQKQVEHQKMIQALKKNDEVITIGGINGTVVNIKDDTITIRIADNVKIDIQKNAIAGLKKSKPEVSKDTIESKG